MLLNLEYYWQKAIKGDEIAFEKIFKMIFPNLCFYVSQITNDIFSAEEIVQELFIKIWQNKSKINIQGPVKTYLYQSAHNQAVNYILHQKTLKRQVHKPASDDVWKEITENFESNAFLIEKLEADDTEKRINAVIENLPDQCRQIFMLSKFENKSNDEIAQQMGISVNTVRTQIYRAIEKIKEGLENHV